MKDKRIQDFLDSAVKRISANFDPEKIILFGSFARGDEREGSDVDLLVILETKGSLRRKAEEIDNALGDRTVPLDLIVASTEQFERGRITLGSVFQPAAEEGKVLYARAA